VHGGRGEKRRKEKVIFGVMSKALHSMEKKKGGGGGSKTKRRAFGKKQETGTSRTSGGPEKVHEIGTGGVRKETVGKEKST